MDIFTLSLAYPGTILRSQCLRRYRLLQLPGWVKEFGNPDWVGTRHDRDPDDASRADEGGFQYLPRQSGSRQEQLWRLTLGLYASFLSTSSWLCKS
jgi:hypothetical protein